jgi:hypothetical protein
MGSAGSYWGYYRCSSCFLYRYRKYLWVNLLYMGYIPLLTTRLGHPINTLWGESNGTCNLQLNTNVSLFYSAIEIAADFSLSIMPAILLWNVQMKGAVKASVAVMLALASL